VIAIRAHGARRRVGRVALLCALGLGAASGLTALPSAAGTVSTRTAKAVLHAPAAASRQVRLVEPRGARGSAPLGGQHRPGKTVTARAVRRSVPR